MINPEPGKNFGFSKNARLLTSSDFSAVFDNAEIKAPHPCFLVLARFNSLNHPRLGLVIAKKNVRLAVDRNRLKRLIRESFRLKQHHLPAIDAIVLARRGSDQISNDQLIKILGKLWTRVAKKAQQPSTNQS